MSLDCIDRIRCVPFQQVEQQIKINLTLAGRQVLIGLAMVVVDVCLDNELAEVGKPFLQRDGCKHVPVSYVKTVTEARVIYCFQKPAKCGRLFLEDVLHSNDCVCLFGAGDKFPPEIDTVFEPVEPAASVAQFVITGVEHNYSWL